MNPAQVVLGPILIGIAINIMLYGVMITQMYLYFTTYKSDRLWIRMFVAILFIADTANTLFDFIYVYQTLINHFGDVAWLVQVDWVGDMDPIMTGIIGGAVQLFFAWRVYVLLKNIYLVAIIVICSLAGILGSVGTTIAIRIVPEFANFWKFEAIVIVWLAGAACADVIIAASLVLYLRNKRNEFSATNDAIDRIIRVTMQTGLVTTLCAVIDLATFLSMPSNGIHLIFNNSLAKLYSNSLMSSLNSRGGWRYNVSESSELSTLRANGQRISGLQSNGMRPEIFVHVEAHELTEPIEKPRDLFGKPNRKSEPWSTESTSNNV